MKKTNNYNTIIASERDRQLFIRLILHPKKPNAQLKRAARRYKSKRNQHVVPFGNGWAVKAAGAKLATIITTKQSEAIEVASIIAANLQTAMIIHRRNGQIRKRKNYTKTLKETW